jgi:hypothetical protein
MMWTTKRKPPKFKPPTPNWRQMMKVWRQWHRPTESEPVDDAWQSRDFIAFIRSKSISGLGEKKLEALGDAIQTFGDFEDLRQQASLNHLPLYDLMPDGFGAKVTEAIENAYLEAQWNQSIEGESDDLPEVEDPPAEEPTEEFDLDSL